MIWVFAELHTTDCCTIKCTRQFSIGPTAYQRTATERGQEKHPSFQLRAGTLQEIFHVWIPSRTSLKPYLCTYYILSPQSYNKYGFMVLWYDHLQTCPCTHLRGELSAAERYDWVLPYCPPRWASCPPKRSHLTLPEPSWRTAQSPDSPPLAEDLSHKNDSV